MKGYGETAERITALLEEYAATGLTVTAIAGALGITRVSTRGYLELFAVNGDVSTERVGRNRVYRPSRRLPLIEVFNHMPDPLVILDADIRVSTVNASIVAPLGIQPYRSPVGARLLELDLPVVSEPPVRRNIERNHGAETYLGEMRMNDQETD